MKADANLLMWSNLLDIYEPEGYKSKCDKIVGSVDWKNLKFCHGSHNNRTSSSFVAHSKIFAFIAYIELFSTSTTTIELELNLKVFPRSGYSQPFIPGFHN